MHQSYHLSHADALKIVAAAQQILDQEGKGAAVAVVDEHGELMAFLRTDGCPLASINISINKAFTAARERKESKVVGDSSRDDRWPMSNYGDIRYTAWGGGVPLFYQGQIVGGLGVSGLPESVDMDIARAAAKVLES
jgi:glc operon protein GlcG